MESFKQRNESSKKKKLTNKFIVSVSQSKTINMHTEFMSGDSTQKEREVSACVHIRIHPDAVKK